MKKGGFVLKALIIILIVIAALFVLTFTGYITNADGKLVEKMYNKFIDYHDNRDDIEEKL